MIIGGLLVLALFAALIGPYFVDWTSYRTAFEREASRALGQPVTVRGTADARLLPFPSVTFSDVAIGKDEEGEPMMTVARFSMDAELAPFLRGEVLIFDMRLEEPSVRLNIRADGTLDWALNRRQVPGETVVLEKVTILRGDILVVDDQNGRSHRISAVDATVSARSLAGPWRAEGTAEVGGYGGAFSLSTGEVGAGGGVRLRARLRPDDLPLFLETEGDAGIGEAKPRYDGTFVVQLLPGEEQRDGAAPSPTMVARGNFEADNERLRVDEYRLELGGGVDPYVVTGEATIDTGPAPEFLLLADGQQVDVNRMAEAEAAKGEPATVAERLAGLNALLARIPPPPLPGQVEISLPAILAGDTTIRDIAVQARPAEGRWEIDRFAASLPGRTRVEANGQLQVGEEPDFKGSLIVASSQPSGLANWLTGEVDPVIRQLGQTGFSAEVHLTEKLQRFEGLEVAVGPAILKGNLERQASGNQPASLSLDLAGDRFDVDAIRALFAMSGMGAAQSDDWLGVGNLSAHIEADELTVGEHRIGGVDGTFVWRDGALIVEQFEFGDLGGAAGRLSGKLEGLPDAPAGSVEGRISAEDAQGLLALADRIGGDNALIRWLGTNRHAFDGLDAGYTLAFGGDDDPRLTAEGTVGQSRFDLTASGPGLVPGRGGARSIELVAENPDAWRLLEQAGFSALPLADAGAGRLAISLVGTGEGEDGIVLSASAGETALEISGKGRIPADGAVAGNFTASLTSPDIEPLLLTFGRALPQGGLGLPVEMEAQVQMTPLSVVFTDLAGAAGGNTVAGQLLFERSEAHEPYRTSGALRLDYVDFDWLSQFVLGPREAVEGEGGAWSDVPFAPPVRGQVPELSLDLGADRVGLGRAGEAESFSSHLQMSTGRLTVEGARAVYRGGQLSGDLAVNNPDGTVFVSGKVNLAGADILSIQQAVTEQAPLSGRASLAASFEGTGGSMRALAKALSGGGEVVLEEAALEGIDPFAFSRILAAADAEGFQPDPKAVAALVSDALAEGQVAVERLKLPFTITSGAQRFAPVTIENEAASLTVEGRIDLVSFGIAADLTLRFKPGREAVAGGDPVVVLSVEGPLAAAKSSIDAGALTNYLSMRVFERERRRVELLQAGVLEKQRLRRVLALAEEQEQIREAERRARKEAEALRRAEEAARRQEEAEARQRAAEEEAQRAAEERAAEERAAEARAAEEARRREQPAPGAVERTPLPPAESDDAAPPPERGSVPRLNFENLPGVQGLDLQN